MTPPLLEVHHLSKEYSNDGVVTSVLHDVSLLVPRGQFLSIMGPSGSGKSTLMQILGLLDAPTSGTYSFDGRDVSVLDDDACAVLRGERIGFIFQAFHLLPKTSVLDNVALPLLYSQIPTHERVDMAKRAIDLVGLTHRLHNLSNQLSGGERQRVAIARALVRRPAVIFADEPTGNLDSVSGKTVMDIMLRLNLEHGHTIILVTHETTTAEYAERILTLHDGAVQADCVVTNRRSFADRVIK